mgnify:FL=1
MKQYILGIEATLEIFGGKWKALITYILTFGTKRTGELQRLIPGISQKVLIEKLKELEKDGIIEKHVYEEMPPKVEYKLTECGQSFSNILYAMCFWGRENIKLRQKMGEDIILLDKKDEFRKNIDK